MRNIREITGFFAMIGGIALSAYSFATLFGYMPPIIKDWRVTLALGVGLFIIGVLFYLLRLENTPKEKAVLDLKDFGFETKRWDDNTYTANAYIDVSSPSVSFTNTFPTITWTNEQGVQVDENNGRWFISNEDRILTTTDALLSVDLDANGKPRRLHFTTNNKERKLYSWWRSPDGYNKSKLITDSPAYLMIFLRANNGETARFRFRITHSSDVLKLERLNNKRQVIESAKEFRYTELLDNEKPIKQKPSLEKNKRKPRSKDIRRFSANLDKELEGKEISSPAMIFIKNIKGAPPFLGETYENPVLPLEHERVITEYFQAADFFKQKIHFIKGGGTYTCEDNETEKEIAEKMYGDKKFSQLIIDANPGGNPLRTGIVINLPRIDISGKSLSQEIELMDFIYHDKHNALKKTLGYLTNELYLTHKEALPLIEWVYRAAQATILERGEK
jgi:hypothetical protein